MRIFINIGLFISFLCCYMEWGGGNSSFIAQAEYDILFQKKNLIENLAHPIILTGLLGQLSLLYGIFSQQFSKKIQVFGILSLGVIVILILVAGILSFNTKMIVSTIPFISLAILYFKQKKYL